MQNLIKIIKTLKQGKNINNQEILNLMREYMQILILKIIYQSKYGKSLSFIGGTALRVCYDIKRFSEDLDFSLDFPFDNYSFKELNHIIAKNLENNGFEIELNINEDKIVQKSFIKIKKILNYFGINPLKDQKLHIKLEIATNPVKVNKDEVESFFVSKFDEIFPILKHTMPTMFAGKISAVLNRVYTKGRDFYDLIWYLNRKIDLNLKYLNRASKQAKLGVKFKNKEEVFNAIENRIKKIEINQIIKDLNPFLEDITEQQWLNDYKKVFVQVKENYLKSKTKN
jgi:predicted nucleotidyltransferase component of viral defense system